MKLDAQEINTLKAIIEGGVCNKLYNRLKWNTAKVIHLSQEEKDTLELMTVENDMLNSNDITLLKQIIRR